MDKRLGLNEIAALYDLRRETVWSRVRRHLERGELVAGVSLHREGRAYKVSSQAVLDLFGEPCPEAQRQHFGRPEYTDGYTPAAERKRRICAQNLRRRAGQVLYDLNFWREWAAEVSAESHAEVEAVAEVLRVLHLHMLRIEHGEEAQS